MPQDYVIVPLTPQQQSRAAAPPNDYDIVSLVKKADDPGTWERLNAPLLPQIGRAGRAAANFISQPRLDENVPEFLRVPIAMQRGLLAGSLEGAANLIEGFTSPVGLATTAAGLPAARYVAPALVPAVSAAQRLVGGGAGAVFAAEGVKNVVTAPTLGEKAAAIPQIAAGLLGVQPVAQTTFRAATKGLPARLRSKEYTVTPDAERAQAKARQAGRPETPSTAQSAADMGYTGTIKEQQVKALSAIQKASTRLDAMLAPDDLKPIPISDAKNVERRLTELADYFEGSKKREEWSVKARQLAAVIKGQTEVHPRVVRDAKVFLDQARRDSSFKNDPSRTSAEAPLKDLSDSLRADLKTALPPTAALLDFESANYRIFDGLIESGARGPSGFSPLDRAAGAASALSLLATPGDPRLAATLAAAGLARKLVSDSPRTRAKMSNIINTLAGNKYRGVPDAVELPRQPLAARVIPRIEAGSAPPSANQAPPRTGGPNERGGFGGINTMGQIMGENQVPFNSGAVRLGSTGEVIYGNPVPGQLIPRVNPNRGNAPVQTMADRPPVLRGVVVDELGNEVGVPPRGAGDYIDAEVVSPTTRALPRGVYAMPSGETPVSSTTQTSPPARSGYKTASEFREEARQKAEKLAKSRQKLAPTVPAKPAAAKTVVQATTPKKVAVDTPKAAASEVTDEINRVIDVSGTTKAIEIKRRVLAALMKEMEPAKKAFSDWDTSGIDSKGRKVNVPDPYTQTITITIPDNGTFRIKRTPDAIAGVIKRVTRASSTAFEGLGSVTSTRRR